VSKALVMSIFRAKLPPKAFLSNKLIASDARHKQSLIFLPLMNPFWLLDTIDGRMEASLSAMIFHITLNLKFAMAMG